MGWEIEGMGYVKMYEARRRAQQTAKLAVRAFAQEPSVVHEQTVRQAWARVRMLDEQRVRRIGSRDPQA